MAAARFLFWSARHAYLRHIVVSMQKSASVTDPEYLRTRLEMCNASDRLAEAEQAWKAQ